MRKTLIIVVFLFASTAHAQNKIEWSPGVEIQFSDFQSSATEINGNLSAYSIRTGVQVTFAFAMSTYEFMFTKNFNKKVVTVFDKNSSYVSAPNQKIANQLVRFSRLEFDLAELSARKFRKRLYESKGIFSNTDFFQPLYDEINGAQSERHQSLAKSTDMGRNIEALAIARKKIREEIEGLSDYCKTCKPPKKRKH